MKGAALPIDEVRAELCAAVREAKSSGRPVVLSAPTGSGKSTRVPGWAVQWTGAPVLVVEPRRVACRALATYLARMHGEKVGGFHGYRVRFDDRTGPDTRVCFVTPGVALNLVANNAHMTYGLILVDEFHERGWEVDLLVAALRRPGQPPFMLCSATLDVSSLESRLDAVVCEATGRSFPVDIEYRGQGAPTRTELDSRTVAAIEEYSSREGDVLVFLPGKGEIEGVRRALAGTTRAAAGAHVVLVHGGIPPGTLVAAFGVSDRKNIFLATNVAESALTVPGVTTVIDSGLVRMRTHRAGRSVLALSPISKASMDQRAGRAGRVAPGHCVRLFGSRYVPTLVTPPEIERVELDDLILRAAGCGLHPKTLDDARWVTPPPAFALQRARARLTALGALSEAGELLPKGAALARLPVSALEATLLVDPPPALAGALADLVALLEIGRDLLLSATNSEVLEARADALGSLRDEVEVQLWCLRYADARKLELHGSALSEARRIAKRLRVLTGAQEAFEPELPDHDALARALVARAPELAFVPREGRRGARPGARRPWANGHIEVEVEDYRVPGADPSATKPAQAGLILDHTWLGFGRSAKGRGRMLLRCSRALLADAGVGEQSLAAPRAEIRASSLRSVEAEVTQQLAGVALRTVSSNLTGAALRSAVVELVMEGRRVPPMGPKLGERLRDALHWWRLLPGDVPAAPTDAKAFLRQRLATLGLEEAQEFAVLSEADLVPDLEAMVAEALVDPRVLAELRQDFPRIWVADGATYTCRVELDRRRVVLEPADRKAKRQGEPPTKLLPRFRGFAVDFVQASRRLRLR